MGNKLEYQIRSQIRFLLKYYDLYSISRNAFCTLYQNVNIWVKIACNTLPSKKHANSKMYRILGSFQFMDHCYYLSNVGFLVTPNESRDSTSVRDIEAQNLFKIDDEKISITCCG